MIGADMDCDFCLLDYDGDEPYIYSERLLTARKPHKCYECRRTIEPGECYERVSGLWDPHFQSYAFCGECSEIGHAFDCGGRTFGNLWDDITTYLFPNLTTGCLEKLSTAKAKQMLVDRWRTWKGIVPR